jgi:hypothetical protein
MLPAATNAVDSPPVYAPGISAPRSPRTLADVSTLALHESFRSLDAGHFTTQVRDVYRLITHDDLSSRASFLLAAMVAWDEAGAGESKSAHDKTLCRIGAELLDQIIADRMSADRSGSTTDNGITPPVEPLFSVDDTERRCGCDAHYACRAHAAGGAS